MTSLWTPDGERPVRRPSAEPVAEIKQPRAQDPEENREPEPTAAEMEAHMARLQQELKSTPASTVIANHCFGFFQLAALHLAEPPVDLAEAQLAIDALGAVVEALKGRLGEEEATLVDGVTQLRLAFVQIKASIAP